MVEKKLKTEKKLSKKEKEEFKPRIRIKLKAFDHRIIDQSAKQIVEVALKSGAQVRGPVPLPIHIKKYTVLRATFVHKDAREQFETRIHKRLIDIEEPTSATVDALSSLNLPAGVNIEIKM